MKKKAWWEKIEALTETAFIILPAAVQVTSTTSTRALIHLLFSPLSDMADPFEVRMRFTNQLQHLNASVTSAQKAANYALKNREMDEDLHSCILEQLERVSGLEKLRVK